MSDRLTVLFWPESAYGPTNNCIGIGNVLLQRGHRVVFAAESSWAGKLAPLGFEEELVDLAAPEPVEEGADQDAEQDAGAFWKDYIKETKGEFQRPTIDQLDSFVKPTFQALIDGAKYCEPRLREIIEKVKPDIVVEDNVICFPALMTAGVPFVRIVSCNPLEIRGPEVAPVFSGYPEDDRTGWDEFRAEFDRSHRPMWEEFDAWCQEQGAAPLDDLEFIHTSEHLNLYVYPEAVDYTGRRPLDATWQRIPSSVRATESDIELPAVLTDRPEGSALIYLSLGSLGSADVDLMERLVDCLSRTPHRYIVSKGPCHNDYELAGNMWGAEFLPQTRILPEVDLVITHGGNNTTVESLHFGKPMIVLPLFWDQYDNAQRMDETGFGIRLSTYTFTDEEMHGAIERLLHDEEHAARRLAVAAELQSHDGVARAAEAIERIVRHA